VTEEKQVSNPKKGPSLPVKPEDLEKTAESHTVIHKRNAVDFIIHLSKANNIRLHKLSETEHKDFKELFNEVIDVYNEDTDIVFSTEDVKVKLNMACDILRDKYKYRKSKEKDGEEKAESTYISEEQKKAFARFKDANLMINISEELGKKHKKNDKQKLLTFVTMSTSRLPPPDRTSLKIRGSSSVGKTKMVNTCVEHFPDDWYALASRMTVASLEDDVKDKNLIILLEKQLDENINEALKQVMEDGMDIYKHDTQTNKQTYSGHVPRKTVIDTSTQNETVDEVANRTLITHIEDDVERFQLVIDTYKEGQDNLEQVIERARDFKDNKPSWIKLGLQKLEYFDEIWIPGFSALPIEVKFKSEGRLQRDTKRFAGLVKAIAWLNQRNRRQIEVNGVKILIAQAEDICWAQYLSSEAFVYSISGLDPKIAGLLKAIDELISVNGVTPPGSRENKLYVTRKSVQEKLEISAPITIARIVSETENLGLVESYQETSQSPSYIRRARGVNIRLLISYNSAIIFQELKPLQDLLFNSQIISDLYLNYIEINTCYNTCIPDIDEDGTIIKIDEKNNASIKLKEELKGFNYAQLIEAINARFIAENYSPFKKMEIGPPINRVKPKPVTKESNDEEPVEEES